MSASLFFPVKGRCGTGPGENTVDVRLRFAYTYPAGDGTAAMKRQIINLLKENGFRITKQRLIVLDVILESDYNSCKEIYFKAAEEDDSIGIATVYRMVNILEELGVVSRKIVLDERYRAEAEQ